MFRFVRLTEALN